MNTQGYSGEILLQNNPSYKFFVVAQTYDLALGVIRNSVGRLEIILGNNGPEISQELYNHLYLELSIDNDDVKILPMTTVDPAGLLKTSAWMTFHWPSYWHDPDNGIEQIHSFDIHQVTVRIGIRLPGDNDINTGYPDTDPKYNTLTRQIGGRPDLVVCFRKDNASHVSHNAWYSPIVKNIGSHYSTPTNLRFYIENKGVTNHAIPKLIPGEEYSGIERRVYWAMRGSRDFQLFVNNNQDVVDEILPNNAFSGRIHVKRLGADLQGSISPIECSNE